jgi:hypothetical protein
VKPRSRSHGHLSAGLTILPKYARLYGFDDARRAQGLGFEFAAMDLDERARPRKLLLENMFSAVPDEQGVFAHSGT